MLAISGRLIAAALCLLGIWHSLKIARADSLFRRDTPESLRAAIRLEPDGWRYYTRLAALDDADAQQLLETAIKVYPYNAEANIELGLRFEAAGDYGRAEKLLLHAFAIDRTFQPRWTLANFYFRRGNLPAFWYWAAKAAAMPSDQSGALFEICWRASPDPNEIAQRILNKNPLLIRQYVAFLLVKDQPAAAADVAGRLMRYGNSQTDDPLLYSVIDRLLAKNNGSRAEALWDTMIHSGWVVADRSLPNNPNFARAPLPVSFDWEINSPPGLNSWPGPSGLETEFSGIEPEDCTIVRQTVLLAPGNYEFESSYSTQDIPPATGLRWQLIAADGQTALAESPDLSSATPGEVQFAFTVPPPSSLFFLRLRYQRALGTTRIAGRLLVRSVEIHAQHSSGFTSAVPRSHSR